MKRLLGGLILAVCFVPVVFAQQEYFLTQSLYPASAGAELRK